MWKYVALHIKCRILLLKFTQYFFLKRGWLERSYLDTQTMGKNWASLKAILFESDKLWKISSSFANITQWMVAIFPWNYLVRFLAILVTSLWLYFSCFMRLWSSPLPDICTIPWWIRYGAQKGLTDIIVAGSQNIALTNPEAQIQKPQMPTETSSICQNFNNSIKVFKNPTLR